ncbi:MAG: biopolymer transporter ExbD [Planctomycetia bacterium]|nr:biopolymer transporter ExbD [Planctomycetia bacterium]
MARKRPQEKVVEGDNTPMIDMVFQLLIFFLILINFSEADQNQMVVLPESNMVKPPEQPIENALTLQIAPKPSGYKIFLGANEIDFNVPNKKNPAAEIDFSRLKASLKSEVDYVVRTKKKAAAEMTVIIRAHQDTEIHFVQKVIRECQYTGIDTFALRVKQKQ